ncbi:MAG: hypothetical protein AABW81_02685 [Nanoarchaeota archaeon]
MKTNKLFLTNILVLLISISFASAVIIDSVDIEKLYPGQSALLKVGVKNTLDDNIEDVSLVLNLEPQQTVNPLTSQTETVGGTPFTTIGSAEDSQDEINEGDKEIFDFTIKAPSNIKPGDYNIPYTIVYTDYNGSKITKKGSFGITVSAKTELNYGVEVKNNVVSEQGKVSVKIINSGLGDIRFVSVKIVSSNGLELLSAKEDYIGTISSDDFELSTFDVLFQKTTASVNVEIKYKDFDNREQTQTITLPVDVYTRERALELGLIQKSKTWIYGVGAGIVILFLIYKGIRKRKNSKREV